VEFPLIQSLWPKVLALVAEVHRFQQSYQDQLEREKLSAMKELAYGASHEINNPLTNIATRAQTLMREERDPEHRRQLATIVSQAFRAHEMIADMMLFAKPPLISPQVLKIDTYLRDRLSFFRDDLDLNGGTIELLVEGSELTVLADPVQLDVALRDLVKNGIEASRGIREILVRAGRSEIRGNRATGSHVPMIEIEVIDRGRGLSAEARRHIFDPFYSGREAGRGLGFGLSKAWRIVEQHGGEIIVASEPGAGTSFTIRLPAGGD
jgi:hypothetical protein